MEIIKNETINNDKNNEVNNFSRNFSKYYQKLKESKEKNNKNIENGNDINNNKITNISVKPDNGKILNSLVEFDLINNNQISNTKNNTKTKMKSTKQSPGKINNTYNHLSNSSRDNIILSTNPVVQTTTVQSAKIKNLKNQHLNLPKRNCKLKNNKSIKNLKKSSFSQLKIESFLARVKEKQEQKEQHINNIRNKYLKNEDSEMNIYPEINKKSLTLLKNGKRKPLFEKSPVKEENNLDKDFQKFYSKTLKENQTNPYFENIQKKENDLKEKYNKFYEDKIKWKKKIEEKNKNRKMNIEKEYKEYIDNFTFTPSLNKKSMNIANKLKRNRSVINIMNNNFYETGNNKEILDKFKTKLKPIITSIYNCNNFQKIYRKNHTLRRTFSEISFYKDINQVNTKNNHKMNKNIENKNNLKINYKINEKKFEKKRKNNYRNKKKEILSNSNINERDYKLLKKLEENKNNNTSQRIKQDLYKLNVRPGTSWNKEVINNINYLNDFDRILDSLI